MMADSTVDSLVDPRAELMVEWKVDRSADKMVEM